MVYVKLHAVINNYSDIAEHNYWPLTQLISALQQLYVHIQKYALNSDQYNA